MFPRPSKIFVEPDKFEFPKTAVDQSFAHCYYNFAQVSNTVIMEIEGNDEVNPTSTSGASKEEANEKRLTNIESMLSIIVQELRKKNGNKVNDRQADVLSGFYGEETDSGQIAKRSRPETLVEKMEKELASLNLYWNVPQNRICPTRLTEENFVKEAEDHFSELLCLRYASRCDVILSDWNSTAYARRVSLAEPSKETNILK